MSQTLNESATQVARSLKRPSLPPATIAAVAAGLDAAAVALGFWIAAALAATPALAPAAAAVWALVSGSVAAGVCAAAGGYRPSALRRMWRGWAGVAGAAALLGLLGWAGGLWSDPAVALGAAALLLPARALSSRIAGWALDYGLIERRAVVIGGGAEAERLIRGLSENPENDIRVCGIFDDRDDERSPPVVIGTPKLGGVAQALSFVRAAEIDMLIVALPLSAERRIREILQQVRVLPVDVRLSAYSLDFSFPRRGGAAGLIEVMRRPLDGWAWLVKRALDVLGASVALLILSPVMIATAIAIKLDSPGPVFFRQMRHGYNNRPVPVLKFRSMYVDRNDPTARKVVSRGDPRVTRVGRFIRRWSIDELPQLLNVLKGDLSLVGPRPHVLDAVSSHQRAFEEIVEGYAARHRVPPGLTGWAQIQGWRGEIDAPEKLEARVAHDLHYIENWSIWLDLYILFVTPFRLLDGRNAY